MVNVGTESSRKLRYPRCVLRVIEYTNFPRCARKIDKVPILVIIADVIIRAVRMITSHRRFQHPKKSEFTRKRGDDAKNNTVPGGDSPSSFSEGAKPFWGLANRPRERGPQCGMF